MSYSFNVGTSFPGLWPGTLFGYQPFATGVGASLGMNTPGGFGGDAFAMGGAGASSGAYAMMQQQMLAAFMMQNMLQLLVDYFSNGGGAMPGAQGGGGGGGGGGGNLRGGGNWGGGRPVSWSPRAAVGPGGGATQPRSTGRTDGPRSQGERGIPNGLRPNAANGARVVRQLGFTGTIGGLGHRSGPSDHPHGNAIDVMTHGDTAMGRRVAEHFRQNHDQLGVKYVIYQQQIASPRTGWQWRPMEDRGSPTANHMDHPHISFH
jgi:hypothetical protein